MKWLEFLHKSSYLDLTELFNVPYETIMEEINSYAANHTVNIERDPKTYLNRETVAVATPIDGFTDEARYKWKAIGLYASTSDPNNNITQGFTPSQDKKAYLETYKNIKKHTWTDAIDFFPKTKEWIEEEWSKYLELSYVKISCLEAHGLIPPHIDVPPEAIPYMDKINSYNILNSFLITINHPKHCMAYHGEDNELLNHRNGSVFWCNQSKNHWVVNGSNEDRWIIRIHGLYKKKFKDIIKEQYIKE